MNAARAQKNWLERLRHSIRGQKQGISERLRALHTLDGLVLDAYEAEIVKRAVEFANQGTLSSYLRVFDSKYEEVPTTLPAPLGPLHTKMRSALEKIVNRRRSVGRRRTLWMLDWYQAASGVRFLYSETGAPRYEFSSGEMLIALVVVWLMDKPDTYDLCQCRLKSCGRFFLAVRPANGRPRRRYCTNRHMIEANMAAAPARVRRSRDRQKREVK